MIKIVYIIAIAALLVGCDRSNATIIDDKELPIIQQQEKNGAAWTLDDSPKKIVETDEIIIFKRVQMNIITSGTTTTYYLYEKNVVEKAK